MCSLCFVKICLKGYKYVKPIHFFVSRIFNIVHLHHFMVMDENWMSFPRAFDEFKTSLSAFLDDMFSIDSVGNQICCPYKKCRRRFSHCGEDVYDQLILDGFSKVLSNGLSKHDNHFPQAQRMKVGSNNRMIMLLVYYMILLEMW